MESSTRRSTGSGSPGPAAGSPPPARTSWRSASTRLRGMPRGVSPRAVAVLVLAALVCLAGCGSDEPARPGRPAQDPAAGLPAPDAPLARAPAALADDLARTTAALRGEIERWTGEGDPATGTPPQAVTLLA